MRRFLPVFVLFFAACGSKSSEGAGTADAQTVDDGGQLDDATDLSDAAADVAGGDAAQPGDGAQDDSTDTGAPEPTCGPQPAFDTAGTGNGPGQRVGDLTLATLDGDWNLAAHWTGCDNYVFIFTAPDAKYAYAQAVWKANAGDFLKTAPTNTHVFFGSYDADDDTATATVEAQKARMDQALAKLTEARQAAWAGRLHYLTTVPFNAGGWLGDGLQAAGAFYVLVDRTQTWREMGALSQNGGNPTLKAVAYDLQRLDYEAQNLQLQATDQATVVPLWDHVNGGNGWGPPKVFADVLLPDAAQMAGFDTLTLDLAHACKDGKDANCPDWDREAYLNLCDRTTEAAASVPMACQTGTDTLECACEKPGGGTSTGKRACNADGSGYGACECPCDTEFARQITSYKRQGRWLTDASPLLPLLHKGGKWRFRYDTPDGWLLTASLRLSKQGKATRPAGIVHLWQGEQLDAGYNQKFTPVQVAIPATAKKVQVVAIITGHGSATDTLNCAEFCNHEHSFTIGKLTVTKSHPLAGTPQGCLKQVGEGAIGNQYGTWPYGRAGWCPGMDVKVWSADVTAEAKPGQTATVSYQALIGGKPFVPVWTGQGDYKPVIRMSSWLEWEE